MTRYILALAVLLLAGPVWADADSTIVWVHQLGGSYGDDERECSEVTSGRTCFLAFGSGTPNTANGATAVIKVRSPEGAVLSFTPDATGTGAGGVITNCQIVVVDSTSNGSETLVNSDGIGLASAAENPTYGLDVGTYWCNFTASGSVPSVLRIEGR